MSYYNRIKRWIEEGYKQEKRDLSRLRRIILQQLKLYLYVGREIIGGKYLQTAAALSFATLIALVPLTTFSFAIFNALVGFERGELEVWTTETLRDWLLAPTTARTRDSLRDDTIGVEVLTLSVPLESENADDEDGAAEEILIPLPYSQSLPDLVNDVEEEDPLSGWATKIVDTVIELSQRASSASMTTAGAILLIFACALLFNNIENAFNSIWHVSHRRAYRVKFAAFCTILLIGPLLIAASWYVGSHLAPLREYLGGVRYFSGLIGRALLFIPPLTLSCLAFFLAYMIIPHTKVSWRNAIGGAVVAALFWEFAKRGFGIYVENMITYRRVYGTLGAIPIFMIWIFISWLIVLFGAGVAYTSQYLDVLEAKRRRAKEGGSINPDFALSLLIEIAQRFSLGKGGVSVFELAENSGVMEDEVIETLKPMTESKMVSKLDDEGNSYQIGKPLEKIAVCDVLNLIHKTNHDGPMLEKNRPVVLQLMKQASSAEKSALEGLTLKCVVERDMDGSNS